MQTQPSAQERRQRESLGRGSPYRWFAKLGRRRGRDKPRRFDRALPRQRLRPPRLRELSCRRRQLIQFGHHTANILLCHFELDTADHSSRIIARFIPDGMNIQHLDGARLEAIEVAEVTADRHRYTQLRQEDRQTAQQLVSRRHAGRREGLQRSQGPFVEAERSGGGKLNRERFVALNRATQGRSDYGSPNRLTGRARCRVGGAIQFFLVLMECSLCGFEHFEAMGKALKGAALVLLQRILFGATLFHLVEQTRNLIGLSPGHAGGGSAVADGALQLGNAVGQRRQHCLESGHLICQVRVRRRLRWRLLENGFELGNALDHVIRFSRLVDSRIALRPTDAVERQINPKHARSDHRNDADRTDDRDLHGWQESQNSLRRPSRAGWTRTRARSRGCSARAIRRNLDCLHVNYWWLPAWASIRWAAFLPHV